MCCIIWPTDIHMVNMWLCWHHWLMIIWSFLALAETFAVSHFVFSQIRFLNFDANPKFSRLVHFDVCLSLFLVLYEHNFILGFREKKMHLCLLSDYDWIGYNNINCVWVEHLGYPISATGTRATGTRTELWIWVPETLLS